VGEGGGGSGLEVRESGGWRARVVVVGLLVHYRCIRKNLSEGI
jgi:hypothetical protein